MGAHSRIDDLADSAVAKIRTVVPAVWGVIVGQVIAWAIGRELLPDVAAEWQGAVTGATVTIVTGLAVLAVYAAARWVEAQANPVSRFVARLLLVVLKAPDYSSGKLRSAAHAVIALDGTDDQPAAVNHLAAVLGPPR